MLSTLTGSYLVNSIRDAENKHWVLCVQHSQMAHWRNGGRRGSHCTWTLAHICLKKLLCSNDIHIQSPSTWEVIQWQKQLPQLHFILQRKEIESWLFPFILHLPRRKLIPAAHNWASAGGSVDSGCLFLWLLLASAPHPRPHSFFMSESSFCS